MALGGIGQERMCDAERRNDRDSIVSFSILHSIEARKRRCVIRSSIRTCDLGFSHSPHRQSAAEKEIFVHVWIVLCHSTADVED